MTTMEAAAAAVVAAAVKLLSPSGFASLASASKFKQQRQRQPAALRIGEKKEAPFPPFSLLLLFFNNSVWLREGGKNMNR